MAFAIQALSDKSVARTHSPTSRSVREENHTPGLRGDHEIALEVDPARVDADRQFLDHGIAHCPCTRAYSLIVSRSPVPPPESVSGDGTANGSEAQAKGSSTSQEFGDCVRV
jgi:hypothetical protein